MRLSVDSSDYDEVKVPESFAMYDSLQRQIQLQQCMLDDVRSKLQTAETTIATLVTEKKDLATENESLVSNVKKLDSKIKVLEKDYGRLQADLYVEIAQVKLFMEDYPSAVPKESGSAESTHKRTQFLGNTPLFGRERDSVEGPSLLFLVFLAVMILLLLSFV
ncbi:hypothetical protein ACHQM5_019236 [Ranunculus cassubicifolius]